MSTALVALSSIPLLQTAIIDGLCVTRTSIFGFRVPGAPNTMTATEAAAWLVARAEASAVDAAWLAVVEAVLRAPVAAAPAKTGRGPSIVACKVAGRGLRDELGEQLKKLRRLGSFSVTDARLAGGFERLCVECRPRLDMTYAAGRAMAVQVATALMAEGLSAGRDGRKVFVMWGDLPKTVEEARVAFA